MSNHFGDNQYFQRARENFVSDVAYVNAVKHLYKCGLSLEEIQKNCYYPVSMEQIQRVIQHYEEEKCSGKNEVEFVEETDAYGRTSFRMVKKNQGNW